MAEENALRYTHPALRDLSPEILSWPVSAPGRPAEPKEVAAAVVFLAAPGASYVTELPMTVDGGRW
jgi:NAD(P)-dependent dehydrogenase (short-subunit alcohol dehydrogenase family)